MNNIKLPILISIERIIRSACAFTLSLFLIQNIGIEKYGEYSYIMAIIGILNVALSCGLDDYIVKEIALKNSIDKRLLYLRLSLQMIVFILANIIFIHLQISNYYHPIVAMTLFYIWNLYYLILITQSNNKNKTVTIILIAIITISFNIIKLISSRYSIYYFSIFSVVELLAITIILYKKISYNFVIKKNEKLHLFKILSNSTPVGLASLLIILFYKLDQIIVEYYLGKEQLGIYALSASIVLAFGFLQSSYVSSCYSDIGITLKETPNIIQSKLTKIYRNCFIIGITVYIVYFLFGHLIFSIVLGENINKINSILSISLLSIIFSGFAAVNSQYLLLINKPKIRLYRTLISILINIILNIIFLPIYGIYIAAIAFLTTQVLMGTILNILNPITNNLLILQFNAILLWVKKHDEKNI